jgi:hypothetical protein
MFIYYSVYRRPDTSANFWLESQEWTDIQDTAGFRLKESIPQLILELKRGKSADELTFIDIKKFSDKETYLSYRKIWLNVFFTVRPQRQQYLDKHNHSCELFWTNDDLTVGGEMPVGIPQQECSAETLQKLLDIVENINYY